MVKKNVIRADECKCCVCGQQAYAFWPAIDPDIPSRPYCRRCLDQIMVKIMLEI